MKRAETVRVRAFDPGLLTQVAQPQATAAGQRMVGGQLFTDLHEVTEAAEQAAVTAGLIRATGIRYVGRAGRR